MTGKLTPDQLDEWRWNKANIESGPYDEVIDEYRRLVREDVTPVSDVDQDVLDTREILALAESYECDASEFRHGTRDRDDEFKRAKVALAEIKARVRREAIRDLPDNPHTDFFAKVEHAPVSQWHIVCSTIAAIKKVYG